MMHSTRLARGNVPAQLVPLRAMARRACPALLVQLGRRLSTMPMTTTLGSTTTAMRTIHVSALNPASDTVPLPTPAPPLPDAPRFDAHLFPPAKSPLATKPGSLFASASVQHLVTDLARRDLSPVTLPDLLSIAPADPSARLRNAQFLHAELPVRLARRCKAFEELPFIVAINPHIQKVYALYLASLQRVAAFRSIDSPADEQAFSTLLAELVQAHTDVIPTISQGFIECKEYLDPHAIGEFLDRLISARIGVRVLAEHHLALQDPQPNFIGIVDTQLALGRAATSVFNYIAEVAHMHYGMCPALVIDGIEDATMAYIPVHLEYILAELFKNAIRATIERHVPEHQRGLLAFAGGDDLGGPEPHLPPITMTIAQTANDVAIRIRDEGGGVPYENLTKIFQYSYTTVKKAASATTPVAPVDESPHEVADTGGILGYASEVSMQQGTGGVLAGLGYGLGMARVYSRYFGGSLRMVSLYGHGCDVFLRLPNIDRTSKDVKI